MYIDYIFNNNIFNNNIFQGITGILYPKNDDNTLMCSTSKAMFPQYIFFKFSISSAEVYSNILERMVLSSSDLDEKKINEYSKTVKYRKMIYTLF